MNKTEFLRQLEAGLARATPDERVAAMQYYTEYLDEAGPEREAEVLEELGDPARIVAEILGSPAEGGESWTPPPQRPRHGQPLNAAPAPPSQNPFDQNAPKAPTPPPLGGEPAADWNSSLPAQTGGYNQQNTLVLKIILLVLAVIFLMPLFGGLLGVVFGVLAAALVLFLCPIILGVSLVASAVLVIIIGALITGVTAGSGLIYIGTGIVTLGLGLLSFYGGVVLLGRVLPRLVRLAWGGVRTLWDKISGWFKKGKVDNNG